MDFSNYLELVNNCDENDTLLSESDLGQHLARIPLEYAINHLDDLFQALDVEQLIRTDAGLPRDYRGLGELMQFKHEIESRFKKSYRHTKTTVEAYLAKKFASNERVSINDLLKMLEKLERFDLIDDLIPTLIDIVKKKSIVEIDGLVQNSHQNHLVDIGQSVSAPNDDDTYDAYICFAAEDYDYAQTLIYALEVANKRVATADNVLPGQFEHDALAQLIDRKCLKFLAVLTPNFLCSKECDFLSKIASEMAIRADGSMSKIIPIYFGRFEENERRQLPLPMQAVRGVNLSNPLNYKWQLNSLLKCLDQARDQRSKAGQEKTCLESTSPASLNDTLWMGSRDSSSPLNADDLANNHEPIIELPLSRASSTNHSYNLSDFPTHQDSRLSPSLTTGRTQRQRWKNPLKELKHLVQNLQITSTTRAIGRMSPTAQSLASTASISPSTSSRAALLAPGTRLNGCDNRSSHHDIRND